MPPLRLSILGPAALHHLHPADNTRDREPVTVTGLGPRATELLIYLAAHPHGVHRDALVAALWPDTGPDRPTNALNSTLTRLRTTLDHQHLGMGRADRAHRRPVPTATGTGQRRLLGLPRRRHRHHQH